MRECAKKNNVPDKTSLISLSFERKRYFARGKMFEWFFVYLQWLMERNVNMFILNRSRHYLYNNYFVIATSSINKEVMNIFLLRYVIDDSMRAITPQHSQKSLFCIIGNVIILTHPCISRNETCQSLYKGNHYIR